MSNIDPLAIVTDFCSAWERRSLEDVLSYLAPDVVYQNVPIPAMHGKDKTAAFLAPIIKNTIKIDFELLNVAVSRQGDEVLTERMDRLHFAGGTVDIPVMGIFVIRDGKIAQWRDYSDNAGVAAELARVGFVV